jgi:3-oxoacyl-[acyl-carrier-protein] synthase-3
MAVSATIGGMGVYVPARVLSNADLERMVATSDEWITTRTGIKERRIAGEGERPSTLAIEASRQALNDAGVEARDLDLIVMATSFPDMAMPSSAVFVQDALGAQCGAFDLQAACSGFIYGLSVASQFITSGTYSRVLLVGSEIMTRYVNYSDRTTCILFGDGAGAVVMQSVSEAGYGVLSCVLGAQGSAAPLLWVPGTAAGVEGNGSLDPNRIQMNGREIFKLAVSCMADASIEAVEQAGLSLKDIDLFVGHQANARILDAVGRRLQVPPERIYQNIARYGNTSTASIPLALYEAREEGRLKPGHNVLLAAFGAGLTWGASVVRWGPDRRG